MTRALEELDTIVHDPAQTHLGSFVGERGPYPGHPASTPDRETRPETRDQRTERRTRPASW